MVNEPHCLHDIIQEGGKSRITRGFVKGLAKQFNVQFDKALDIFSSNVGRNFTERQAYGLFTLALDKIENMTEKSKLQYVITEFPLNRGRGDEEKIGRLDYLVNYNNVIYAIELKLAYAGLGGGNKGGGKRLRNTWAGSDGVVQQLININTEEPPFTVFGNITIVKLPVLIVCYYRLSNNNSGAENIGDAEIDIATQDVYKNISNKTDGESWEPLFVLVSKVGDYARETGDDRHIIIHGLGFFAGADGI